jgi:hypothetical protein
MITHGSYYGDKSDVWSIGGIMLELILGGSLKDEMLLERCTVSCNTFYYDVLLMFKFEPIHPNFNQCNHLI